MVRFVLGLGFRFAAFAGKRLWFDLVAQESDGDVIIKIMLLFAGVLTGVVAVGQA